MKLVFKIFNVLTILIYLMTFFCVPKVTHAQTLGDLKEELEAKEKELQENENKKVQTESEIASTKSDITNIKNDIDQTYTDMANLQKEIDKLDEDIKEKQKEIKEILSYVQLSNGESAYLEYAFGAADFTDFIYRVAVAEQLTSYNEELINEFNKNIDASREKQDELKVKQGEMAEQQKTLESKVTSLGEELTNIESVGVDIKDAIEYQKEIIALYEKKGCEDHEDIATCGRSVLPYGTAFYRPTDIGQITSEWGPRDFAGRSWHEGIDVGVSEGTTVYAVANGMVAMVLYQYYCGGNMVVVHHNINGRTYTTVYAHLLSINVSKGETVNRNTIIGYSGGYSTSAYYSGSYDQCSYGAHLHLTVATGLYGVDYYDWLNDLNITYSINPRSVINMPAGLYNKWTDRITAY